MRSCWRVRPRLPAVVVLSLVALWPAPALAASSSPWRWPLAGVPAVLRPFQPPPTPYAAGHRGVDLAAPTGAAVLSAGDGVVGYAGSLAGRGVLTVVHGALRTTYEPVTALVHVGQRVAAGTAIGRLQPPNGHCGVGRPCLHWGLLRGEVYLDPLALLGLAHSILLPLGDRHPRAAGSPPPVQTGPARWMEGTPVPAAAATSGPPTGPLPERPPPWLPLGGTALLLGAAGLLQTTGRWTGPRSGFD